MARLKVIFLTTAFHQAFVWGRQSSEHGNCLSSEGQPNSDPAWILLQGNLIQSHDSVAAASRGLTTVDSSGDTDDVSDGQLHQLVDEVDDGIHSLRSDLGGGWVDLPSTGKNFKRRGILPMAAAPRRSLILNAPDLDEELVPLDGNAFFQQHPHLEVAHGTSPAHGAPPAPPAHGAPPTPPPAGPVPPAHGAPPAPPVTPAHGAPPAPPAHGAPPAPPAPPPLVAPAAPAQHVDLKAPPQSEMAAAPSPQQGLDELPPPLPSSHGAPAPPPKRKRAAAAPNARLVKEALRKEKEKKALQASGDLHYTQHGCHCLVDWTFQEEKYKGCSKTPGAGHTGHAWCKVTPGCEKHKEGKDEGEWDLCNVPGETDHHLTLHGCHCAPEWFWKDELYEGCGKTSQGPSWCYVFESDALCHGALRTEHAGQHWDYCSMEYEASSILTKGGCHCQPEWVHTDGVHYKGCVASTPDKAYPWCYVFEDAESCPAAKKDAQSGRLWDQCWLLDEKQLSMLDLTVNGCHCEPEWEHKEATYKGCASTPDRPKKWCYLLEDEKLCEKAAGFGEGLKKFARWDYCGTEDAVEPALPGDPPTYDIKNTSAGGGVLPENIWKDKDFPEKDGAWTLASWSSIAGSILVVILA